MHKGTDDSINSMVDLARLTCLKSAIILRGLKDDGKTTTLKDTIRQMHDLYPCAWIAHTKYNAERFDIFKPELTGGDYMAVFRINGIVIVMYTGGDNPSILARVFSAVVRYQATIVVSALKISGKKSKMTRAQVAYERIECELNLETTYVDICGQKLRVAKDERKVATRIVDTIQKMVQNRA